MNKKINIFGVGINDVSISDAVNYVSDAIRDRVKYLVFTPNVEFIVKANEEKEFSEVLNKADLAIPDGFWLRLASGPEGKIKNTTTGIDLMEKLCEEAATKGWRVGLLGGKGGVAAKASGVLKKRYPKLKVVFTEDGGTTPLTTNYELPSTDILFVAFGQGKQEKWIYRNRSKVNSFVFMGVGGSFDYIAGDIQRAPKWMRRIGMEWLFRLIMQPWRIKRQLKILKYIWLVLTKN